MYLLIIRVSVHVYACLITCLCLRGRDFNLPWASFQFIKSIQKVINFPTVSAFTSSSVRLSHFFINRKTPFSHLPDSCFVSILSHLVQRFLPAPKICSMSTSPRSLRDFKVVITFLPHVVLSRSVGRARTGLPSALSSSPLLVHVQFVSFIVGLALDPLL